MKNPKTNNRKKKKGWRKKRSSKVTRIARAVPLVSNRSRCRSAFTVLTPSPPTNTNPKFEFHKFLLLERALGEDGGFHDGFRVRSQGSFGGGSPPLSRHQRRRWTCYPQGLSLPLSISFHLLRLAEFVCMPCWISVGTCVELNFNCGKIVGDRVVAATELRADSFLLLFL